jgi:hypothetical protein
MEFLVSTAQKINNYMKVCNMYVYCKEQTNKSGFI